MFDVALACVQLVHLRLIDVETEAPKTSRSERSHERKTDVSEAYDADDCLLALNQIGETLMDRA
jgi:hypothetical protein